MLLFGLSPVLEHSGSSAIFDFYIKHGVASASSLSPDIVKGMLSWPEARLLASMMALLLTIPNKVLLEEVFFSIHSLISKKYLKL